MSVLIHGMQMPENCKDCPVSLSGKYCRINKTHTTFVKLPIRPDHCPLVELPEKYWQPLVEFIEVLEYVNDEGTSEVNLDEGTSEVNLDDVFKAYFEMKKTSAIIEEGAEL